MEFVLQGWCDAVVCTIHHWEMSQESLQALFPSFRIGIDYDDDDGAVI